MKPEILYSVKAQRGNTLRCKGWKQEAILRMMENNMENGEKPEDLVIYGGKGKCARNWESYYAIRETLMSLENNETLAIQSGMPVAVFKTHRLAPRVLMANTNMIQANWEKFYDLQDKNLIAFASYTAGPWQYIGSQGVIQGTFETLGAVAKEHFNGSLIGRIFFTAGLGGMGKTQPLAMSMHGGVTLVVEVREKTIEDRVKNGFCDRRASDIDEGILLAEEAKKAGKALSIAVLGNAAELYEKAANLGFKPDIVTEMCPCHDPFSLIPSGIEPKEAESLSQSNRPQYLERSRQTMAKILRAMNRLLDSGAIVFEYGTFIRKECMDAGMTREEALHFPGAIEKYIRPMFLLGRGPFRWTCISGDPKDHATLDQLVLDMFPEDDVVQRWIPLAHKRLPIEGLPARICFLGFGQRRAFGLAANKLVKEGKINGPIAFSRDNLDCGSISNPLFETENMKDGSDTISDWPYLNALLNTSAMADLVTIQSNGSMGMSVHTGVTMIADGSDEADLRLDLCLTTDAGIGIVRYAQAGYDVARQVAEGKSPLTHESIKIPLWWSREATFGPSDPSS